MINEKGKKFRVPKNLVGASWGTFFQDLAIELIDSDAAPVDQENPCQITNASFPEKLFLENENVHSLLKYYFEAGENFDLVSEFCSSNKEVFSIKIHDYLNLGHFVDAIIIEAYKNEFQCENIRTFLNSVLSHSFHLLHAKKELGPIEIFFGASTKGFVIQASLTAKNFELDKNLYNDSNFVDVTEYEKKSRVVISAMWFKDEKLKNLHFYFHRKQVTHKNVNLGEQYVQPVLETETVSYEPKFDQESSTILVGKSGNDNNVVRIKGSKEDHGDETIRIKGTKEDQGDDIIRIKGSGQESSAGNMRVSSNKAYVQMEQQMLRMKDLIYKMKEQLQTQKLYYETMQPASKSDQELRDRIELLEAENLRLEGEKKYINARLQLANRKMQIMDSNLDKTEELARSHSSLEQEQEIKSLKQQKIELEEKLNSLVSNQQEQASKDLELHKLAEIKVLYENKLKEQAVEIKKLDARLKVQTTQLEGALKKLASPTGAIRSNENHAKQLEHASNRVAEVTKEFNEKKKEVIQVKQENAKLIGRIHELEKKIQHYERKAG